MRVRNRWVDPFAKMTDEEFDRHIDELLVRKQQTVGISMRVPADLLDRVKRQAAEAGVPYQTFMKSIIEATVARLERKPRPPRAGRRRSA